MYRSLITSAFALSFAASFATAQTSTYIDAGSGTFTDAATGRTWVSDVDYNGGWPYSSTTAVGNTAFSSLYQTQRVNSSGDLVYNIPMSNGNYSVVLRFAELWFTGTGSRVFNVFVNGSLTKQNLDVVAAAGGRFKAYDLTVPVTVTSGKVTIDLQPVRDNPILNAIDISPAASAPANAIQFHPGDNVQQKVNSSPSGTTFYFNAGTYSNLSIVPKDGDVFQAASGTVLNGSRNLSGQFSQINGLWYAYDADPQGKVSGICDDVHPACIYPEELYLNNKQLLHVTSTSALGPGRWFFDYLNHQVIMFDNPSGQTVEISLTPTAFSGSASNVSISGLVVEKYASPFQYGTIGDQFPGPGWIISNVEARFNHGVGVTLGSSGQLLNSYLHHNGDTGVSSSESSGVLVQHNEISFNNMSGLAHDYEASGAKFSGTDALVVRNNYVHDNDGIGLWTDTDNRNTLYENNFVFNNANAGIEHENSFAATIRNNVLSNNGLAKYSWLWGSQFLIQNSQSVEAYGNICNAASNAGNGVGIVNQNRGSGQYGAYVSQNNYVHDNDVTYQPGSPANSGLAADYNQSWFFSSANNVYSSNHYHMKNTGDYIWQDDGNVTWTQYQANGNEHGSTIDSNVGPPPAMTWN